MKIVCPTCNTNYNIPDSKIPAGKNVNATCKKCGNRLSVSTGSGNVLESSPAIMDKTPLSGGGRSSVLENVNADQASYPAPEPLFKEYPDLRNTSVEYFNFNEIFLKNKKGSYKSGHNKFKARILMAIHKVLSKILHKGEIVLKIGKGVAYYPVEIFLGNGYLTMMYNHYAIACTDQRILLININSKIKHPTHYFFQIPYESLKKVKRGLFGRSLIFTPYNDKKRIINSIQSYLSKDLSFFVQSKIKKNRSATNRDPVILNLCPSCFVPLEKGLERCPKCRSKFKSPKTAFIRSLILPGLGDFYLGHRALGVLEIIASIIVWIIVILTLLSGDPGSLIGALILLIIYNGIDSLITLHMAKKGYLLFS